MRNIHGAGRRGSALMACLITLPISMIVFALVLTQIDAARIAAVRREDRAQARLLAESAIHVMRAGKAGAKVEGKIEGAGEYRVDVERDGVRGGGGAARAVGVVTAGTQLAGIRRIEEQIDLEMEGKGGAVRIVGRKSALGFVSPEPGVPPGPMPIVPVHAMPNAASPLDPPSGEKDTSASTGTSSR